MASERWLRIKQVFADVLAKDPDARAAFLAEACADDPALRQEVESLLRADEQAAAEFMGKPAVPAMTPEPTLPSHFGRYRIVRLIGEGGMGVVYEAEQENPRRAVALKIIRPGFARSERLRRFEQEAELLGRLQHPGVAQIYDAGTADTGSGLQPYFVMELVRGQPLLDYVKSTSLPIRPRLELMVRICDAVHHAHERGIIHRDLKPNNILVDETGQPKVLDFGVARTTDSDVQATQMTNMGDLVGTLPYMSPEQVAADPRGLDIRTDVYSLGVILYEVLAGRQPYDVHNRMLPEMVQIIRERDPASLSSINRVFRGDVETIVAKALEKEKSRRYSSAAELGADIRRYLRDEPIVARPASAGYQLRKFAHRNRALVAGATAVLVVLIAGAFVSAVQAIRATRAERLAGARLVETEKARQLATDREREAEKARQAADERRAEAESARAAAETARGAEAAERQRAGRSAREAKEEAARADAVNAFLNDMLGSPNPYNRTAGEAAKGRNVTVLEVLGEAVKKVDAGALKQQPLVEAAVRQTLGITFRELGDYSASEVQLRTSLSICRRVRGQEHPCVAASLGELSRLLQAQGKLAEAEPLAREALAMRRKLLSTEHEDVATSLDELARVLRGRGNLAEAEPLYREGLAMRRKVLGEEHRSVAASLNNLALLLQARSKPAEAEPLHRQALALQRRLLGDEHPDVATSLHNLARLLRAQGKLPEAEPLYREALALHRKLLGDEHPSLATSLHDLALLLYDQGKMAEGEPLSREALAVRRKLLGDEHPEVATTLNNLAMLLRAQGKLVEAEPLAREALARRRKLLGDENPAVATSLNNLALLLRDQGKLAEAEPIYREALALQRKRLGDEHPNVATVLNNLAGLLNAQGKLAGAEPLYREALAMRRKGLGNDHPDVASSLTGLAGVLESERKPEEAEPLLREALAIQTKALPAEHLSIAVSRSQLGGVLAEQKRFAEAEVLLHEGYRGIEARPAPRADFKKRALERLVKLYETWDSVEPQTGKAEKAAEWRAKLFSLGATATPTKPDNP